jgi:hypothetical protein
MEKMVSKIFEKVVLGPIFPCSPSPGEFEKIGLSEQNIFNPRVKKIFFRNFGYEEPCLEFFIAISGHHRGSSTPAMHSTSEVHCTGLLPGLLG